MSSGKGDLVGHSRRSHLRWGRWARGSCWGTWRKCEGAKLLRAILSLTICTCWGPRKRVWSLEHTFPSMGQRYEPHRRCWDFGSIGWLGSLWQSTHHCEFPRSRPPSRGKHPRIRGCSSTRQHGRKDPEGHDFDRNGGRNCGSKSCRIGRHSKCWSMNQP